MKCRELLAIEHPEKISPQYAGGCKGCPGDYGYIEGLVNYSDACRVINHHCVWCWDQEVPNREFDTVTYDTERIRADLKKDPDMAPFIKDSGNRREFETGAVRDIQEGKGRCDLMPLDVVAAYYAGSEFISMDACTPAWVFHHICLFQKTGKVDELIAAVKSADIFAVDSTMFLEVAKHFEEGAKKYGEYNWQKGIPTRCYIDSAIRHYLKFLRGDTDEPHDRAFVWNILCCIWTCKHKPELNDYAKKEEET